MVAQRFVQQFENLGALKDLVDLVKNPAAIIAAHEEARKQISLTAVVEAKAEEAKAAILKHSGLVTQLDNAKAALETDKKMFVAQVEKAKSDLLDKENQLRGLEENLNAVGLAQAAKDKAHALERAALDAGKAEFEKLRKVASDVAAAVSLKNSKDKDANDAKSRQLADMEASLKAKAAKLRGAVEGV